MLCFAFTMMRANVIETHEHAGEFKEPQRVKQKAATR